MLKAMRIPLTILAVTGLVLLTGCSKLADPLAGEPEPTKVNSSVYVFHTDILADQTNDVGDIDISWTYDNIYLRYTTTGNWWLTQTHCHVATSKELLPHSGGGLIPGRFDYGMPHDPPVQTYQYVIPVREEWRVAEYLYVAAHCVVQEIINGIPTPNPPTGWGNGEPYPGSNWSLYFKIPVLKTLHLPPTTTTVKVQFTGVTDCGYGYSPTQFHVWNIPAGYSMTDDYYRSFCLDRGIYIYGNAYDARLWSSYDPTMPDYMLYQRGTNIEVPYDKLNYMLNKYGPPYTTADIGSMQRIFWYWRGQLTWDQLTPADKIMFTDADLNGAEFYPAVGQWMAVLLDIASNVQLCFVIVDP